VRPAAGYLRDWLAVAPETKRKVTVDVDPQSFL
jgi:hypothetical protein